MGMKHLLLCATTLLLLSLPLAAADEARRIAKINAEELQDAAVTVLLSKPENAAKKQTYEKLHGELTAVQVEMGACKDEESLRLCQQKFTQTSQKEQEFRQSIEPELKRIILNAVREVSKGKFVAVLDSSTDNGIVFKDVELVDITYDTREKLIDAAAAAPIVVSPSASGDAPAPR